MATIISPIGHNAITNETSLFLVFFIHAISLFTLASANALQNGVIIIVNTMFSRFMYLYAML